MLWHMLYSHNTYSLGVGMDLQFPQTHWNCHLEVLELEGVAKTLPKKCLHMCLTSISKASGGLSHLGLQHNSVITKLNKE